MLRSARGLGVARSWTKTTELSHSYPPHVRALVRGRRSVRRVRTRFRGPADHRVSRRSDSRRPRITDFEFSLIAGLAFAIFYAVLGIPIGLVADRWSRRNLVAIGIALWSVMTGLCGLAGNYLHLFRRPSRSGRGRGTLTPSAISLISDLFPRERRGLPINVYTAGVYGGIGIANIFGA